MFCTGIWEEETWHFIVWGLQQFNSNCPIQKWQRPQRWHLAPHPYPWTYIQVTACWDLLCLQRTSLWRGWRWKLHVNDIWEATPILFPGLFISCTMKCAVDAWWLLLPANHWLSWCALHTNYMGVWGVWSMPPDSRVVSIDFLINYDKSKKLYSVNNCRKLVDIDGSSHVWIGVNVSYSSWGKESAYKSALLFILVLSTPHTGNLQLEQCLSELVDLTIMYAAQILFNSLIQLEY